MGGSTGTAKAKACAPLAPPRPRHDPDEEEGGAEEADEEEEEE